jgi:hypothetical protein
VPFRKDHKHGKQFGLINRASSARRSTPRWGNVVAYIDAKFAVRGIEAGNSIEVEKTILEIQNEMRFSMPVPEYPAAFKVSFICWTDESLACTTASKNC